MADATCSVENCESPTARRGWCTKHYHRWHRHGDPESLVRQVAFGSPAERFWVKVDRSGGPDACWLWTASTFRERNGYGKFNAGEGGRGKTVYAHRFSYELANGPIPLGGHILHSCDNPPCVNPAHLRVGTRADNMSDMVARGRNRAKVHPESYPTGDAYWAQRGRA